jgi:uncharacterized membrane protein YgaE (UPF0421/DUF939 family)
MPTEGIRARIARLLGIEAGPKVGISFVVRTTCAAIASLLVAQHLHIATAIWAVVSAVVVILPEVRASVSSAMLRVTANLVGAAAGIAVDALGLDPTPSLALGFVGAAGICRLFGIDVAARTACVAVVIVLFKDPSGVRESSATRVALVALGCAVALVVTLIATAIDRVVARLTRRAPEAEP